MHQWFRSLGRACAPAIAVTILTAGALWGGVAAASDHPRLLVYLEVPQIIVANRLTLDGLELRGQAGSVQFSFEARNLVAEDLAGKQILLASADVPAGVYSDLKLEISGITGPIGVAEVSPESPPDGLVVPVDLVARAGHSEILFLYWNPGVIDPEKPTHKPDVSLRIPAIPPLGSLAFATSNQSGSVMVMNRKSGRIVGALRVGNEPRGLAYSRNEQTLFVALGDQDAVAVVDVMSLRVINTVNLQFGDDPTRLLLAHDGATLFVLCPGSRSLTALSVWSLQQQFRVALGEGPRSVAQDPVSGLLYVACEDEGRVQVVDPGTGSVSSSLSLIPAPVEIVIDEQSRQLFLAGSSQRVIRSFDLATEQESGDLGICGPASGIAVNPRTRRLYAAIPSCRNLAVIRPDIGIEYGSVSVPSRPGLISFDPEFRQLWVVLPEKGMVAVCNANRGQVEFMIEVGADPYQVLVP